MTWLQITYANLAWATCGLRCFSLGFYSLCSFVSAVGDGRAGYLAGAPYDAIHVGAAAATLPQAVSLRLSNTPGQK